MLEYDRLTNFCLLSYSTIICSFAPLFPQLPASSANPFFDNIRQNRELAHGITERIPLDLPELDPSEVQLLPAFLKKLIRMNREEQAEDLAQNFFQVERDEQKRLLETMQKHASESGTDPRNQNMRKDITMTSGGRDTEADTAEADFPFSICAALERGSQNRYNNIWPYEHTRIKLSKPQVPSDTGSDYLNANLLFPSKQFGSKRTYIATQAPLPSTFDAFWTAIWEQNVRVIVMLTREHEGGRQQAHDYWSGGRYGEWKVEVKSQKTLNAQGKIMELDEDGAGLTGVAGTQKKADSRTGNGMFPFMDLSKNDKARDHSEQEEPSTVVRTLNLSRAGSTERREVTQLQYIAWPDYHIPETPESLLNFAELASSAQLEASLKLSEPAEDEESSDLRSFRQSLDSAKQPGPMLVHCSAGVGRTGTFIVIDTVLEILRKFRSKQRGQRTLSIWDNGVEALGRDEVLAGTLSQLGKIRGSSQSSDGDSIMSEAGSNGSKGHAVPATPPPGMSSLSRASSLATARRNLKRDLSPTADEAMNGSNTSSNTDQFQTPFSSSSSKNSSDTISTSTSAATDFFSFGAQKDRSASVTSTGSSSSISTATSSIRGRDVSSPPPLRRSRSSTETVEGSDKEAGFFDPITSAASSGLTPRIADVFSGANHGEVNDPGTPSRAMGSLHLGPQLGSGNHFSTLPIPATQNNASSSAGSFDFFSQSSAPSSNEAGLAASSSTSTLKPLENTQTRGQSSYTLPSQAGATSSSFLSPDNKEHCTIDFGQDESVDLIRRLVDKCREQRMSTVQTNRQYVCIIQSVVAGVLRETEREQRTY